MKGERAREGAQLWEGGRAENPFLGPGGSPDWPYGGQQEILLLGGSVRFWCECVLCFCCCNKIHLEKQLKKEGLILAHSSSTV